MPGSDIDVSKKGITIVDPRWHRTNDTEKKFVMMLPLREASGENIGEIVLAYKNPPHSGKSERDFFAAAMDVRDQLQPMIRTYLSLFQPATSRQSPLARAAGRASTRVAPVGEST